MTAETRYLTRKLTAQHALLADPTSSAAQRCGARRRINTTVRRLRVQAARWPFMERPSLRLTAVMLRRKVRHSALQDLVRHDVPEFDTVRDEATGALVRTLRRTG
jgi:hypothetical protein